MPSFRVQFQVSGVRAGHRPDEVLGVAREAGEMSGTTGPNETELDETGPDESVHCDDVRLDMPRGVPTVTVRFTIAASNDADEGVRARRHGARITQRVGEIAVVSPPRLARRRKGQWIPLPG
jgi:hypothetical protein